MQSSHFPVAVVSDSFKPSTKLLVTMFWIVNGLQWVKHRCHCSREVGWDKDPIARGMFGMSLTVSRIYIPFMPFPARTTVPSSFRITPRPLLKVVVSPALLKVLMEIKLAFKAGV